MSAQPGEADTSGWNPNAQEAALLRRELEAALGAATLDGAQVGRLLPLAMQTVQAYGLPEPRKKALVLDTLRDVIHANVEAPEARTTLLALVDTVAPALIDQFVAVATGALDLGKRAARRWCGC